MKFLWVSVKYRIPFQIQSWKQFIATLFLIIATLYLKMWLHILQCEFILSNYDLICHICYFMWNHMTLYLTMGLYYNVILYPVNCNLISHNCDFMSNNMTCNSQCDFKCHNCNFIPHSVLYTHLCHNYLFLFFFLFCGNGLSVLSQTPNSSDCTKWVKYWHSEIFVRVSSFWLLKKCQENMLVRSFSYY